MEVSDVFKEKLPEDFTESELEEYIKKIREERQKFLKPKKQMKKEKKEEK